MKNPILRWIAPLALLPVLSHAQGSVTLYGIADMSIDSMKSGTSKISRVSSGGTQQTRWGLRGVEDLGGGLKAEFNLESRFTMDDGVLFQGLAFGGRSVVGLSGGWGSVMLGREYVPLWDVKIRSNPYTVMFWAPSQNIIGGESRTNNAISYRSPNWSGLEFSAMYGVGDENPLNREAGRQMNAALQYSAGKLWVGGGFTNVQRKTALVNDVMESMVGARYSLGQVSLFASYWRLKTDNVVAVDEVSDAWTIGASAQVTPNGTVRATYTRRDGKTPANDDATQFMVGYEHGLSKRTALYANYARMTNKGNLNLRLGGFANTGAAGNFSDPRGLQLGIRHTF